MTSAQCIITIGMVDLLPQRAIIHLPPPPFTPTPAHMHRYGDVPARTDGERITAAFCMLMGAFLYAYVVGSVCNIATSYSAEANE